MRIALVIPTIPDRVAKLRRCLAAVEAQARQPDSLHVQHDVDREGAAATRNRALVEVAADWVAFVDDDDELYPQHLRALARHAVMTGADVVYPGYDVEGGEDPVNCFGFPFDPALLLRRNYIPVTALARTRLVLEAGGFQEHPDERGSPCEDWGLWLAMLRNGAKFSHLPQRTWRWHVDAGTTRGMGLAHGTR